MKKLILTLVATTAMASSAMAAELPKAGDFVMRARALGVVPSEDATVTGAVTGNEVSIDNSVVPEVDFSYFLTNNIAFELIAAVTPHDVSAANSSAGPLDLGEVWLLPPTLTAQYHFTNLGDFKPYVGAGINYTVFYDEKPGASVTSVDYGSSFGPALQAGADYMLDDHWMVNVDVKKIWINTDVDFNGGAVRADVDIDPWVIGVGFGYKF